jgi:hypothetical protein
MNLNLRWNVHEDIIQGLDALFTLGYIHKQEDILSYLRRPYAYKETLKNIKICPVCEDFHECMGETCLVCD